MISPPAPDDSYTKCVRNNSDVSKCNHPSRSEYMKLTAELELGWSIVPVVETVRFNCIPRCLISIHYNMSFAFPIHQLMCDSAAKLRNVYRNTCVDCWHYTLKLGQVQLIVFVGVEPSLLSLVMDCNLDSMACTCATQRDGIELGGMPL